MIGLRSLHPWILGVLVCPCLAAFAQGQAPASPERAFFDRHPVLQFIEQRLPATATIVIPPDPARARHVATDSELQAALSRVLEDFLAPPSILAGKAGDLIEEICRYRPNQAPLWVATATDTILSYRLDSAEKDLERAVTSAVSVNRAAAGPVAAAVVKHLGMAARAPGPGRGEPLAIATAGRYAGKAIAAAVAAVKSDVNAPMLIVSITDQALHEATEQRANSLIVEIMASAVRNSQGIDGITLADLAKGALIAYAESKEQAGIIAVGALKGAGADLMSTIKDQAALNLSVAFASYITVVCNSYVVAADATDAPPVITHFISVTNADFIPAVMIGAITAHPESAAEILEAGLNRDLVLRGRATTSEILQAAIMACESAAPKLAAAAVGRGDLMEASAPSEIGEGLARGSAPVNLAAALRAQIAVQKNEPAEIKATVSGALSGATAAARWRAVSTITQVAAAGSKRPGDVLDQALISAPPGLQYAAVLGVLAGNPVQAPALLARALQAPTLTAGQAPSIQAGGELILEMQQHPEAFFDAARRHFAASEPPASEAVAALVEAAALVNPRGASAVAAAAMAKTDLSPEKIIFAAELPSVRTAVEMTARVKASPSTAFRQVWEETVARPDLAAEIVTGAMAAAPASGTAIGRAAALAAPGAVGQVIPRLFAFAGDHEPETLAGLTVGVLSGVLSAGLDSASERRAVEETVAASVKTVLAMDRDSGAPAGSPNALPAIISAAARAAQSHTIGIAREAGRAVRALSGAAADREAIVTAIRAGNGKADAAKVTDAVAAGFTEADLQVPAAEVKGLFDYAHDSLSGTPMTRYRDL